LRAAYGESWACGPEAFFTVRRYNPTGNQLGSYQTLRLSDFRYARRSIHGDHLYIEPIVIDLMDNYNQRSASNEYPIDRVSGYTLHQIAYALQNAHNLDDWKNNLMRISNPTNVYLNEYFNQYFEERAASSPGNTIISIKAVAGIWYSVDWVEVNYLEANGTARQIRREADIPLCQEARITVPTGSTNIRLEAKPRGSAGSTRIFHNLALTSGHNHCFHLTGSVNNPHYERVNCSF
jgi:hypothetical protein